LRPDLGLSRPPEKMPPAPKFAWTQAPQSQRHVTKVIQECNWLQGLEGGLDTSHAPIMHRTLTDATTRGGIKPSARSYAQSAHAYRRFDGLWLPIFGIRPWRKRDAYPRYHFIPAVPPDPPSVSETGAPMDAGHIWVPMDDDNTMVFKLDLQQRRHAVEMRKTGWKQPRQRAVARRPDHLPVVRQQVQQLPLDRDVQRNETFTGIEG